MSRQSGSSRHPLPTIPVKPLSRLLGGASHCEWAVWFQAHNEITKRPSDLGKYIADHDAMLRAAVDDLRQLGYTFFQEWDNAFVFTRPLVRLEGRPDLIAFRQKEGQKEALIIECKTGKPCPSDLFQIKLYMWAVPRADNLPQYRGIKFSVSVR